MVKFNTLILNNSEKIHTFVLNFIHFYLQNNLFSDLTIYETNNHLEHYNDIIMKIPYQIYTEDKKPLNNQVLWSMVTTSRQVTFFPPIKLMCWYCDVSMNWRTMFVPRSVKHYVIGEFFFCFFSKHMPINSFVKSNSSCRIIFQCLVFQNSIIHSKMCYKLKRGWWSVCMGCKKYLTAQYKSMTIT